MKNGKKQQQCKSSECKSITEYLGQGRKTEFVLDKQSDRAGRSRGVLCVMELCVLCSVIQHIKNKY